MTDKVVQFVPAPREQKPSGPIATVTIAADGTAVVSGGNILADRDTIIEGLTRAVEFLKSHGD